MGRGPHLRDTWSGTVADADDNALASSVINLVKTELISRTEPWKTFTDVEFATARLIDWYDHQRLHGASAAPPQPMTKPPAITN